MFKRNTQAMPSQFEWFSFQEQLWKEKKGDKPHTNTHQLLCPAVLLLILLITTQVTCNFHLKPVWKQLSLPFLEKGYIEGKKCFIANIHSKLELSFLHKKRSHLLPFPERADLNHFDLLCFMSSNSFPKFTKPVNAWVCVRNIKRKSRRFLKDTRRKVIIYIDCDFLCVY